jgi:hypothetical protein
LEERNARQSQLSARSVFGSVFLFVCALRLAMLGALRFIPRDSVPAVVSQNHSEAEEKRGSNNKDDAAKRKHSARKERKSEHRVKRKKHRKSRKDDESSEGSSDDDDDDDGSGLRIYAMFSIWS